VAGLRNISSTSEFRVRTGAGSAAIIRAAQRAQARRCELERTHRDVAVVFNPFGTVAREW
jgi:hypothetical protein